MFTLDQIKSAKSKVKSGADFPRLIHEFNQVGIVKYTTYLKDGHTDYYSSDGTKVSSEPSTDLSQIAPALDQKNFETALKIHQNGGTDYPTFCKQAISLGVSGWTSDLEKMTCTYFDINNVDFYQEIIPKYNSGL